LQELQKNHEESPVQDIAMHMLMPNENMVENVGGGQTATKIPKDLYKKGGLLLPVPASDVGAGQHAVNFEEFDVYENDEMMDCFMDDIDERSMCEGSRQS